MTEPVKKRCQGCREFKARYTLKFLWIGGQKVNLCPDCVESNNAAMKAYIAEDHRTFKARLAARSAG